MSDAVKKAVEDMLSKSFPDFDQSRNGAAFLAPIREHYQQEFAAAEKDGRLEQAIADAVARLREIGFR